MSAFPRRGAQMRGARSGLSAGIPRPACDGPYTVGRFSKPTHAPSGGKPPKSTPFRVYFLNSIFLASLSWIPPLPSCSRQAQTSRSQSNKGPIPDLAEFGRSYIQRPCAIRPDLSAFFENQSRFSSFSSILASSRAALGQECLNIFTYGRSGR